MTIEVKVPDIGDFTDVEVIEVLVNPGDQIEPEDPLISLESDKATMEVPSPHQGTVKEVSVSIGDKVSEGSLILTMEAASTGDTAAGTSSAGDQSQPAQPTQVQPADIPPEIEGISSARDVDLHAQVVVLGAGPGGYTAAFRAADLGLETVLIERYPTLGGVCLNVGCIPSKALLHTAQVIAQARDMEQHGVRFKPPNIDLTKLRSWKDSVVAKLTGGLSSLARQRKVRVIQGYAEFSGASSVLVDSEDGEMNISFEHAIIAAGSRSTKLPIFPEHDRILDSTSALSLPDIPDRLLVVGGGIIGLEMATVYRELGSGVSVVELTPGLMPGADRDLIKPFQRYVSQRYENIYLSTKVTRMEPYETGVKVYFEGDKAPESDYFDYVLVAVGRTPNSDNIGIENVGIELDQFGCIPVDSQQRTRNPRVFAIGDIVGQPMLAHKATHEGKVAAEVCAGLKSHFDAKVIPSVAYTDPEVAWVGLTEEQAKSRNIDYGKGVFPWAASGRSLGIGRDEGMTKLLFERESDRIIGAGIVGPHAGDLIAEAALAIEMGSDAADIGLTIHPHPTLSETIGFAAEAFEGTITDLYMPKKKK